jgi:hypothetical protein
VSVAGRIACGALVALGIVVAAELVGLVGVEWAVAELGFLYSDERAAEVAFWPLLLCPIVGGWLGWVRRP